ncbi:hypothetical protein A7Q26_09215 [Sphingobium sp. TCM1]|nr:hypothetical protein A7Q26_09215 [Sphingobium sp. TCM1]
MGEVSANAIATGTSKITDVLHGMQVVETFQKGRKDEATERSTKLKALETASRKTLYDRLGMAWEVIQELMKLSDVQLGELLDVHGLVPVKPGYNKFAPLNTMLWGEWKAVKKEDENSAKWAKHATRRVNGTMYWFKDNRSAEKYAKVMRYAHDGNLTPRSLIKQLEAQSMDKVLEADTTKHSSTDKEITNLRKYRAVVLSQPSLVTVTRSDCGVDEKYGEKVVALWGRISMDGNIEIMGHYPASADAIQRHIDKVAKEKGKDLYIAQLEKGMTAGSMSETEAASAE